MKPKSEGEDAKVEPPLDSKLAKPLQELMKLIFNMGFIQQSMASLSYDSKKLPLGKLSKQTILRGYEVLKMIGEVIANPTTATSKYSEYGPNVLSELSSRYYTVIPHEFGRRTPPIINTPQLLKREAELVENLVDMKISSEIIKDSNMGNAMNVLDKQYETLGLNEAVALDRNSKEFKLLEAYAKKTHGQTHARIKLNVQEIFRIRRSAEEDRWTEDGWDSLKTDNRKLLWHGSRTTNFGGILSQGLRIAPPEAPVNGYMFGKVR
jgi:poly [ADP-ribose] polymerase